MLRSLGSTFSTLDMLPKPLFQDETPLALLSRPKGMLLFRWDLAPLLPERFFRTKLRATCDAEFSTRYAAMTGDKLMLRILAILALGVLEVFVAFISQLYSPLAQWIVSYGVIIATLPIGALV